MTQVLLLVDLSNIMNLIFNCCIVITDSGGVQEETSYLGIPCLTLRKNTERPITVTHGTNQLCELDHLAHKIEEILRQQVKNWKNIDLWDGRTAETIMEVLRNLNKVSDLRDSEKAREYIASH